MNMAFITVFNKTDLFEEVAKKIQSNGREASKRMQVNLGENEKKIQGNFEEAEKKVQNNVGEASKRMQVNFGEGEKKIQGNFEEAEKKVQNNVGEASKRIQGNFEEVEKKPQGNEGKEYNDIFWITTSIFYYDRLISRGVDKNKILYLNREESAEYKISKSELQYLLKVERDSGLTLNAVYYMDRIISKWDVGEAKRYFYYIIFKVREFINSNNIRVITGETTAAHEVLISMVAKAERKQFVQPFTIRYPSDSFGFFEGVDHSKLMPVKNPTLDVDGELKRIYDSIIKENTKPAYWYKNNKIPKYNVVFLSNSAKKFVESLKLSKTDASVKSLKYHLVHEKKYMKPFNAWVLKNKDIFESPNYEEEKFVLFTLHKQPEASIDVLGYKFDNQIETVRKMSKLLPEDTYIYVKEHTNALGERNLAVLQKLKEMPNVKLIDPYLDTKPLIKNAQLIVTISGTVAYEAGIMLKPTVTFANMFFSGLSSVRFIEDEKDFIEVIKEDIHGDTEYDKQYLKNKVLQYSFKGTISDVLNCPECISEENVAKIEFAYKELIKYLNEVDGRAHENFNNM